MKIIKNEKLIKRNGTIANWAGIVGMLLVLVPGYFFLQALLQQSTDIPNAPLLFGMSLAGILVSQVGMYMGPRYGRSPRLDEKLDAGLKGLPNEFSLYHYMTPASHLLVGPAGVWIIKPYQQRGKVTFAKNRWRLSGGGFLQAYMRIFGQEGLGRPDIEIDGEISSLKKYLEKHMEESEVPEINAVLVFTAEDVELEAEAAPAPALKLKQLKDFLRQKAKERKLPASTINQLRTTFE